VGGGVGWGGVCGVGGGLVLCGWWGGGGWWGWAEPRMGAQRIIFMRAQTPRNKTIFCIAAPVPCRRRFPCHTLARINPEPLTRTYYYHHYLYDLCYYYYYY